MNELFRTALLTLGYLSAIIVLRRAKDAGCRALKVQQKIYI
jgi:hypothetical protein